MSGFVLDSPTAKQQRFRCASSHACAQHVMKLPYFSNKLESIINEGGDFDEFQHVLDTIQINGATWTLPDVDIHIHFSSQQYAHRVKDALEDIAEDRYNSGISGYQSQFSNNDPNAGASDDYNNSNDRDDASGNNGNDENAGDSDDDSAGANDTAIANNAGR